MKTIGKFTVGTIVGLALTLSVGGVATAAAPPTNASGTTAAPKKGDVLNASQIWRRVNGDHRINCKNASKELKHIAAADAAITKRTSRWDKVNTAAARSTTKRAARVVKHSAARVKYFQKFQNDGAALIKRIDTQCGVTTPST
jgi:hypothetical protein